MGKISQFSNNKDEKVTKEQLEEKFNTYKNMSSDQLSSQLFKEVAKQKEEGSFDYKKLESMVESLRGMLDEKSYQNVKRILESLK